MNERVVKNRHIVWPSVGDGQTMMSTSEWEWDSKEKRSALNGQTSGLRLVACFPTGGGYTEKVGNRS